MTDLLNYQDVATFVTVSSGNYANDKTVTQQVDIPVIFLQNTAFSHGNYQDIIDADAICYVDPENDFIKENFNKLEGMYILEPLFGAGDDNSWYKVIEVRVNRDHLLDNVIDNIELRLKKSTPISGVS